VARPDNVTPVLAGVPETMLWALHNRAIEAKRRDGILVDSESVRIHDAIDYDFTRQFGDPGGSLAARAAEIDRTLRCWLGRYPDGTVVSLGEGLETQSRRVDNGRMRWLSVDLPDAIDLRERFLTPTPRFRHIAASALDPVWMDAVDPTSGVFVIAQGLLMYLEPQRVGRLLINIADRFPGVEIVFDSVPRWFSRLTRLGLNQTPHYRLPPMPWGIDRDEIEPTLRRWIPHVASVAFLDYGSPRGLPRVLADMTKHIPVARHGVPSLVQVFTETPTFQAATSSKAAAKETSTAPGLEDRSPTRNPQMTSIDEASRHDDPADTNTMVDMLTMATRNNSQSNDLVKGATQVVAKRVALGMAAAFHPSRADDVEFTRMVPEKMEAFSAASAVMLRQSDVVSRRVMSFHSDEVAIAVRAGAEMIGCGDPMSLAKSQVRFARAWFDRAASNFITLGMLALTGQAATMAPIRETVFANADRLGRCHRPTGNMAALRTGPD